MSATGKDTNTASTGTFVSALVLGVVIVVALTAVFFFAHGLAKFKTVYESRRYFAPEEKKPPILPPGIVPWWRTIFATPDVEIIRMNGVDGYLFVRFIKVFGLYMLVPYFLLTFAICIPLSAAKPNNGETGLNILTFGNVALGNQDRHIGHFLVAIILIFWTLYLIHNEYLHFTQIRQQWLNSPEHLSLARTRTVALVNVPESMMSASGLTELAGTHVAPSAVGKVWLTRDVKDLEKVYDERNKECLRLEAGEGKLLALATKNVKKGKTPQAKSNSPANTTEAGIDLENHGAMGSDALIDRYVLPKKRPTWKQGLLGLVGKKMDLKDSPEFIKLKSEELEGLRKGEDQLKQGNVAFIRFNSQHDAHVFARVVQGAKATKLVTTHIEVVPEDIQWSNTSMAPRMRQSRTVISWALTIGLMIVWAPILAFVGLVSNVDALCVTAPWLAWICKIPSVPLGIIKGILPPVLLAVVFMLLPPFLRLLIKLQGVVLKSDIELRLFSRFWLFQVIHGFLIITLASGLVAALSNIGDTASSIPTLLSSKLPQASIFFLTFILASSFSGAAKSYSQVVPVIMHLLLPILGGKTPRKFFASHTKMPAFNLATTWPPICLLVCITIVYSVIQPMITLVALVAFVLLYAAYKYLLGWCADQPDAMETGGLYYPKALKTVFVSLYLEEICLAGLFFLSKDAQGRQPAKACLAGGILMAIMLVITILAQIYIQRIKFPLKSLIYSTDSLRGGISADAKLNLPAVDNEVAGEHYGNTTGLHERAFDHPATWKAQPVVWVANDSLGIGSAEVERIRKVGVDASTDYATMDAEGGLHVERAAPDEIWYGGSTR